MRPERPADAPAAHALDEAAAAGRPDAEDGWGRTPAPLAGHPDSPLLLHSFFRSSTSLRVRAALGLKGLAFEQQAHDFRRGAQRAPAYLARNPQGLVPTLTLGDGTDIPQSLAILEWLDETWPEPPLLPPDPRGRARVRALAHAVALDVHPLNNLRVLERLRAQFRADDGGVAEWFRHWASLGFEAVEARLARAPETGRFCHGDAPGLADLCLVAQSVNNGRFDVDEAPYPTIRRIVGACLALPAFEAALPENQPDAV